MFLEELANYHAECRDRLLHILKLSARSLTSNSGTCLDNVYAHLRVTKTHPEMAVPRCIGIRLFGREHPARREQNSRFSEVYPKLHFKGFLVTIERRVVV